MNAIALHKDELEKLLVNLSHDTAVSGSGFVALLDAYITRLDADCRLPQSRDARHSEKI
jgi:hypothetical protein